MKIKNVLALVVLALGSSVWAQQPASGSTTASSFSNAAASLLRSSSFSDEYCSGFINKDRLSSKYLVGGGIDTPESARFNIGDYIFIMGEGLKVGDKLSVVRELRDANRYELFKGQYRMLRTTGQPYADIGQIVILGHQNKAYIGRVEFNCEPMLLGDLVVPMFQRAQVNYQIPSQFDRFPGPNNQLSGRIVMAKDFDYFIGNGQKVYLNVGANQGVKVGDYFRITRDFTSNLSSEVDALTYKAPMSDDTQRVEPIMQDGHQILTFGHPVVKIKDFPRVSLGEVVILNVTPTSSTAMVTFALQDMHAGDTVEKISGPNDVSMSEQK
jgi:hypothetical protein